MDISSGDIFLRTIASCISVYVQHEQYVQKSEHFFCVTSLKNKFV